MHFLGCWSDIGWCIGIVVMHLWIVRKDCFWMWCFFVSVSVIVGFRFDVIRTTSSQGLNPRFGFRVLSFHTFSPTSLPQALISGLCVSGQDWGSVLINWFDCDDIGSHAVVSFSDVTAYGDVYFVKLVQAHKTSLECCDVEMNDIWVLFFRLTSIDKRYLFQLIYIAL